MLALFVLALARFGLTLVAGAPLPQDAPVSTLAVDPTALSPAVTSSKQTSNTASNPGADVGGLLGQLSAIQGQQSGTDAPSQPSDALANSGSGSPADAGGSASLEGLLQSIKQASAMTSGMTPESSVVRSSAQVLAANPTTTLAAGPISTPAAAVLAATSTPAAAVLAANTTATAAPAVDSATTFDLNDFLAGASFPAEATTAIPGTA